MNNEYSLRLPLLVTPIRILPVNKILRYLGRIQFIAKSSSMYRVASTIPFGEVGRMSPLQLSSQTHFVEVKDKKLLRNISSKNLTAGVLLLLFFLERSKKCFLANRIRTSEIYTLR